MDRKFVVDYSAVAKIKKKKKIEILQSVGYGLLFLAMLLVKNNEDMLWDLAGHHWDKLESAENWVTFMMFVFLAGTIVDLVYAIITNKKLQRYEKSYVVLSDTIVSGLCFPDKESLGEPFSVPYTSIVNVSGFIGEDINLRISTKVSEYACLAIKDAQEAARLIRQKIDGRGQAYTADGQEKQTNRSLGKSGRSNAAHTTCFCMKCGAKMPQNAKYCPKCGDKVI